MCYTNSHGGLTKVVVNMDSMPKTWAQCWIREPQCHLQTYLQEETTSGLTGLL